MRRTHCCPERSGDHETLATPTAQEMDMDETDAQVQEADAALARTREESAAKRRKTNPGECDAPARAEAELDKAIDDARHAALGGLMLGSATQSAQQG